MIIYEGEKVRLRPLGTGDIESSLRWRNDPDIRENILGHRFPVTAVMEEEWYAKALNDQTRRRAVFAIETLDQHELIGLTGIDRIDWIGRIGFFGIIIGEKKYQGKKMAQDAMHILFNYAFGCLNLRKICLEAPGYNKRAINLYLKFGFIKEGCLREQIYLEGKYHGLILMGLMEQEYRQKYK